MNKDVQLVEYAKGTELLKGQFATTSATYENLQKITADEHQALVKLVNDIKTQAATHVTAAESAAKNDRQLRQKADADFKAAQIKLRGLDRHIMDVPTGEIIWVSLANKMVWINRGRADDLQRQTKFTVFSSDSSNPRRPSRRARSRSRTSTASTRPRPASSKISSPIRSWLATRSSPRCGRRASKTTSPCRGS